MRIVAALGGNALLERGEPPESVIQEAHVIRAVRALAPLAAGTRPGDHARQRPAGRHAGPGERARPEHLPALPVRRAGRADPGHDRLLAGPGPAERAARPPGGLPGQPDPGRRGGPGLRAAVQVRRPGLRRAAGPRPGREHALGDPPGRDQMAPGRALPRARRTAGPAGHPATAGPPGDRGLLRRRRGARGLGERHRPGARRGSSRGQGPDRLAARPAAGRGRACCC